MSINNPGRASGGRDIRLFTFQNALLYTIKLFLRDYSAIQQLLVLQYFVRAANLGVLFRSGLFNAGHIKRKVRGIVPVSAALFYFHQHIFPGRLGGLLLSLFGGSCAAGSAAGDQYSFAPAGMWGSTISRCSFSSPFS